MQMRLPETDTHPLHLFLQGHKLKVAIVSPENRTESRRGERRRKLPELTRVANSTVREAHHKEYNSKPPHPTKIR